MTTIQYVAATALSLVVFVAMANFVVDLYARGVVRAAVDEGARAGAPIDASADDCEQRTREVLTNLLGGASGRGVRVSCREIDGVMHAQADAILVGWLPGIVPTWSFTLDGTVTKERDP
jgi:hypothetical protein